MRNTEKFTNRLPIIKKAFGITADVAEPWYFDFPVIEYAETAGAAKQLALNDSSNNLYEAQLNKESRHEDNNFRDKYPCGYLDLNASRKLGKPYDRVLFRGEEVVRRDVMDIMKREERCVKLNEILEENKGGYAYIRKGSYYRPNCGGYTDMQHRAGVYTIENAVSEARGCGDVRVIIIDVEEHNKIIHEHIEDLKTRLIIL